MHLRRYLFQLLLGKRLPITSGTISVSAIESLVTVHRDEYGVPHIEAQGDTDAWYAVGFCQGQDRAFQLELLLRVAKGTLSESIGPRALPADRLSRRIGFAHGAGPQLEALDPDAQAIYRAFARGLTDGVRLGCRKAPHEFAMTRSKPTPFTTEDVVAVSRYISFLMAPNWKVKLARHQILKKDGALALSALEPWYPEWHPVSEPPGGAAGPAVDRLAEDLELFEHVSGYGGGSNAWAVGANRSATGRPILANDPHLPPSLPSSWYLAHIATPDWAVAGATLAGAPLFAAGHNGYGAWGVTLGMADNTDLFIEEMGPDGKTVRDGDLFLPCKVRREVISVKGGDDVVEDVAITPRGPIIGPALGDEFDAVSMRATWLEPRPTIGLLRAHRARSFEEFRRMFEQWPTASLNMVYADEGGTIGWQLAGQVPRRKRGSGTMPQPGADVGTAWEGEPVPFDEMPYVTDPPSGTVASANNRPKRDDSSPYLGIDWIDGYRLARISEALGSRDSWDVPAFLELQMDDESLPWREVRDLVLSTPTSNKDALQALGLLEEWDGRVSAAAPAAAVFELFTAEMSRRVARARAPLTWEWALGKGVSPVYPQTLLAARRVGHLVRLLREQPEGWFQKTWTQEIEDSLVTAVKTLKRERGQDVSGWGWGQVRTLTLRHPAGATRLMGPVFNRGPMPWGGDANTVGQSAPDPIAPTGNPLVIASMRMVVPLGDWEDCRFVLPGGQSGNPLSPHYDDMLPLWQRGEGVPIPWSQEEVAKAARATLTLSPGEAGPLQH